MATVLDFFLKLLTAISWKCIERMLKKRPDIVQQSVIHSESALIDHVAKHSHAFFAGGQLPLDESFEYDQRELHHLQAWFSFFIHFIRLRNMKDRIVYASRKSHDSAVLVGKLHECKRFFYGTPNIYPEPLSLDFRDLQAELERISNDRNYAEVVRLAAGEALQSLPVGNNTTEETRQITSG